MSPNRIVLAAALLALLPVSATAGRVGGRLYLSRHAAWADSVGRPATLAQLQTGVRDAVISVEPAPTKIERKLEKRASHAHTGPRIDEMRMRFVPRVMVVTAGDSVMFTNLDSLYHNAFSVSSARRFELGRMPPGTVETVTFDHPGVINLHCEIHPEMIGYIVVLPHRVYARPDSLGSFKLPNLPRGHYVLHTWHPLRGEMTRSFDVPRHGDTHVAMSF
jgi:plastocyanin